MKREPLNKRANTKYQSRYIAYAKAHSMRPDKMLEYDSNRFPGGLMCGYILWITKTKKARANK